VQWISSGGWSSLWRWRATAARIREAPATYPISGGNTLIVIVDYKTANLGSLVNILKRLGIPARVAESPEQLRDATRVILPGIGHFDTCARNLRQAGFASALEDVVLAGPRLPLLGICVGAQLLTRGSEEGAEVGLGWVDAVTRRFPMLDVAGYKVPHMGWNLARPCQNHVLFSGFGETQPRFYFVHSYYMKCEREQDRLAQTTHGVDFDSAITRDNIAGVQFHPEKSHKFGMKLLQNFAKLVNPGTM
jgi:imidazole glycerol-phosphate synthase subunit HisH